MATQSLGIQVDLAAPDSEGAMLGEAEMEHYLTTHQQVFILFDNDRTGREATQKYTNKYGQRVTALYWDLEKDPSDAVFKYDPQATYCSR